MKTKAEILAKIEELEMDPRLSYPMASVFVNAPLALIQISLKTKIQTLKWVLDT
ncbi:MAG: hypothetical protein WC175_01820 [Candidatus Dojkabacteria bacterium]|jgi:hypothetical protein